MGAQHQGLLLGNQLLGNQPPVVPFMSRLSSGHARMCNVVRGTVPSYRLFVQYTATVVVRLSVDPDDCILISYRRLAGVLRTLPIIHAAPLNVSANASRACPPPGCLRALILGSSPVRTRVRAFCARGQLRARQQPNAAARAKLETLAHVKIVFTITNAAARAKLEPLARVKIVSTIT